MAEGVKFIRVNGRVVPIKVKGNKERASHKKKAAVASTVAASGVILDVVEGTKAKVKLSEANRYASHAVLGARRFGRSSSAYTVSKEAARTAMRASIKSAKLSKVGFGMAALGFASWAYLGSSRPKSGKTKKPKGSTSA